MSSTELMGAGSEPAGQTGVEENEAFERHLQVLIVFKMSLDSEGIQSRTHLDSREF